MCVILKTAQPRYTDLQTFAGDEGGDDPSRVGGPTNPLLAHASLDTSISARDGRTGMSRDLQRAQSRANAQAIGPGGRSVTQLQTAFGRITEFCDKMQLPRAIAERAQHAYKIGDEARVARGRNDVALIAASIIFATRDAGAVRSFREIGRIANIPKSEVGRVFTQLKSAILAEQSRSGVSQPQGWSNANQSAEGLLGRFCNYLDLGNQVYNASKYIAEKAVQRAAIDGRSPLSIAAGVLYFTCILFGKATTAREIAEVAGVSESTIKL